MSWVRIDTSLVRHPKILALTAQERWHHLCAMAWTAENHTDGLIPRSALVVIVPAGKRGLAVVEKLVSVGLWEEVDEDSWLIHDWLEYNISGERSKELKEQRAERQRKWREKRQDAKGRNASRNALHDASNDASGDTSLARRRARVRPDPTRPLPRGRDGADAGRVAGAGGATTRVDDNDEGGAVKNDVVETDGLLRWERDELQKYENTGHRGFLGEIEAVGTPAARRRAQYAIEQHEKNRLQVVDGGAA